MASFPNGTNPLLSITPLHTKSAFHFSFRSDAEMHVTFARSVEMISLEPTVLLTELSILVLAIAIVSASTHAMFFIVSGITSEKTAFFEAISITPQA